MEFTFSFPVSCNL